MSISVVKTIDEQHTVSENLIKHFNLQFSEASPSFGQQNKSQSDYPFRVNRTHKKYAPPQSQ